MAACCRSAGTKRLASLRVGGKGQPGVELELVANGRIEPSTKSYGAADALCCPSVVGHSWFELRAGSLEETESRLDGINAK